MSANHKRRGRRGWAAFVAAVSATAIMVGFLWGASTSADSTVLGVPLRSGDVLHDVIRLHAEAWLETEVTVDVGTLVMHATRRELGGRVDESSARALAVEQELRELPVSFDRLRAQAFLDQVRSRAERSPVPSVEQPDGEITPGIPGLEVDLLGAIAALQNAVRDSSVVVRLPVREVAPIHREPLRLATAVFLERVAGYETRYAQRGDASGRATNIELAAAALNGQIIAPGTVFSFNRIVGERSEGRGYQPAVEIRQGRRVDGIGGGVCQVAATLHAAAFFAGFEIIEHHPHSRNLGYIEAGLDAAVAWELKDLRIRNPFPFFVKVQARSSNGSLSVHLFGQRPGPPVEWAMETVEEIEPTIERVTTASLPPGAEQVIDEGEAGMAILRTRTIHGPDGVRTDERTIRYPVASRVVQVGAPSSNAAPSSAVESEQEES